MSNSIYHYIGIFLVCYLLGSIPCGYLIGKFNGIDIRRHGSKNIGATNVLRTLGKSWGYFCFFLDFSKGFFPVLLVMTTIDIAKEPFAPVIAAGAVVIGHIFPIYLRFIGGKGVATSIGVLAALAPLPLIVSLIVWQAVFLLSRYVSLASCISAAMFPILRLIQNIQNHLNGKTYAKNVDNTMIFEPSSIIDPTLILLFILAIIIIYRHKTNIIRLRNGTENRFERKK